MGILHDIFGIKSPSEDMIRATIGGNHLDPHQAAQYTPPAMPECNHTREDDDTLGFDPTPERVPHPAMRIAVTMEPADDRRPCWVRGKKAMFHCWVNAAHPVPPRNVPVEQIDEKTRYFQFRSTTALVEFEDGTCARVYPNEIQFADGGRFEDYAWLPMAEGGQEDGAE